MKTQIVTPLATLSLLIAGCASNQAQPNGVSASANEVVIQIEGARENVEYEVRHLIGSYKGHAMAKCDDVTCSTELGSLLDYDNPTPSSSTLTFKYITPLPQPGAERIPPQEEWEITLHWAGKTVSLQCVTWHTTPVEVGKTGQLIAATCFGQL